MVPKLQVELFKDKKLRFSEAHVSVDLNSMRLQIDVRKQRRWKLMEFDLAIQNLERFKEKIPFLIYRCRDICTLSVTTVYVQFTHILILV